jgi:hypothetical protein
VVKNLLVIISRTDRISFLHDERKKIFTSPIKRAIDIESGEENEKAI